MRKVFLLLFLGLLSCSLQAQDVFLKKGRYYTRETGKPFTGLFTEFDTLTKRPVSETSVRNGFLDGNTVLYYASGLKKEVRSYREGKKHGLWKTWNESGGQTAEASFMDGEKDGAWSVWDDQGIKRYEMFYRKGQKSGTWIIRDETGKEVSRESYP